MKYLKIVLLLLISFVLSCKNESTKEKLQTKKLTTQDAIIKLSNTKVNSEGAFLFNSGDNIILNWTEWYEEKDDNILRFTFFNKTNHNFSEIIEVPSSKGLQMHAESMAKVAINKAGIIYAIFRLKPKNDRSRFGGLLYYTMSKDKGKTWSDNKRLVADTTSTSQSFYDIALLPDGELGMVWLDSREIEKNKNGKTVFFAKTEGDKGFLSEIPIAGSTCQCCRTEIYVDKNKRIHVAYRNIIEPGEVGYDDNYGTTTVEIRDMYYLYSDDNGKTFTKPIPISRDNWHINGCPHTGPSLALNGDKLGAVWFTAANANAGIFFTTKSGDTFNPRELLTNEGRHPQMIVLGNIFYIVYEEYYEKNDKGYTKIVLEKIDDKGIKEKIEVSSPNSNNNHAVLASINDNSLLIVWVNTDTRKPKIEYKLVQTN